MFVLHQQRVAPTFSNSSIESHFFPVFRFAGILYNRPYTVAGGRFEIKKVSEQEKREIQMYVERSLDENVSELKMYLKPGDFRRRKGVKAA